MEDAGDPCGWPREGLCLLVDANQGRSRPAWKVRHHKEKVVVYGESRGQARRLNKAKNERLEPLPNDIGGLAKRLQEEWKSANSSQRESLVLGLDEMEARRIAPPAFVYMIDELRRASLALGTQNSLGPCGSIGREFYPNLFAPQAGDTVRVLYDSKIWYEAIVLQGDESRRSGPASLANYFAEPKSDFLSIRFLDDGQRDSIPWPDPEDEAFLVAEPPSAIASHSRRRRPSAVASVPSLSIPRDWRPFFSKVHGNFEAGVSEYHIYLQRHAMTPIDRRRPEVIALQTMQPIPPVDQETSPKEKKKLIRQAPPKTPSPQKSKSESSQRKNTLSASSSGGDDPDQNDDNDDEVIESQVKSQAEMSAAFLDATTWFYTLAQASTPQRKYDVATRVVPPKEEKEKEETQNKGQQQPEVLTGSAQKAVSCCLALRILARPLSALLEDFGTFRNRGIAIPRSPVTALAELADALSLIIPTRALPSEFVFDHTASSGSKQSEESSEAIAEPPTWLTRPEQRPAAKAHLALLFYLDPDLEISIPLPKKDESTTPPMQEEKSVVTDEDKIEHLRAAAATVADGWDQRRKHQPIGVEAYSGAPCFAMLDKSQVTEPHKAWLLRASEVARSVQEKQALLKQEEEKGSRGASSSSNSSDGDEDDEDDDIVEVLPPQVSSGSTMSVERLVGGGKKRKKQQAVPRRYRPPGAAARKIMCGGDELAMEVLPPEICASLAGGLGSDMSSKIDVVRLDHGPMRGERGVVARCEIETRSVLPYAGLVVSDDELAALLWLEPRAVSHCLMYRYEFAGPQISVLPYLQSPEYSPAPFINCARGPHSTEAVVWQTCILSNASRDDEDEDREAKEINLNWRSWGSKHIGARLRRTIDGGGFADGTVVAWLDANESDFAVDGIPTALWRVKYDNDSPLAGDFQDLELSEVLASAKAPPPAEVALEFPGVTTHGVGTHMVIATSNNKQANCHFEEVTADGAVLGVYVVASRKIVPGESLLVTYGCEFWSGWIQRRSRLDELDRAANALCLACRELIKAIDSDRAGSMLAEARAAVPESRHTSCCDENDMIMNDDNARSLATERREVLTQSRDNLPTRIGRHEVWRYLVGVPFQARRAIRGQRNRIAVVVGLAVEPPANCSLSSFEINDRVEGFWRGGAPTFPAILRGFNDEGDAFLEYDDGANEVTDRVIPRRSQHEWSTMPTIEIGTWVRHFKQMTTNKKSKREGIIVSRSLSEQGDLVLDVISDDGFLEKQQAASDWEPLLIVRFAADDEQRVMSIEQILYMQPLFLDAGTKQPLFVDASVADDEIFSFLDHNESVHYHLLKHFFQQTSEDTQEQAKQNKHDAAPPCLKVDVARALFEAGLPRMPKLAREQN